MPLITPAVLTGNAPAVQAPHLVIWEASSHYSCVSHVHSCCLGSQSFARKRNTTALASATAFLLHHVPEKGLSAEQTCLSQGLLVIY